MTTAPPNIGSENQLRKSFALSTNGTNVAASACMAVDLGEARQFLNALGDEYHCFQTFADCGADKSPAHTLHGTLQERTAELTDLNRRGAGIFVTPNVIAPGQRRLAKNTTRVRALFIDADNPEDIPEVERRIAQLGLQPSIIVESSPGKFHYYWRTDDFPLDGFKPAQQRLAKLLGTDPSVCDPSRVMRLPGFIHQKGQPWRTRLVCVR
jgi:hypothetical protein